MSNLIFAIFFVLALIFCLNSAFQAPQRDLRVSTLKHKNVGHQILLKNQSQNNKFVEKCQRLAHMSNLIFAIFFVLALIFCLNSAFQAPQRDLRVSTLKRKSVGHQILHKNQSQNDKFVENCQRLAHMSANFLGTYFFFCVVLMLGVSKINSILGTYFFFCVVLVWGIKKIIKGHIFFSVRPLCGTYFLSRFSVKALRARSARYARSAPRPAFGRPWRALRWDKYCS